MAMYDWRRTDLRTNVLETPYWISSGLVDGPTAEDAENCLFSFPTAGLITIVHEVVLQVVVALTASTVITIGSGTLATDAVTTGGTLTNVDADEYLLATDITVGTPGFYGPVTGQTTSDWLTAEAARTWAAPRFIKGAATTVPVVYAVCTNTGTITAGSFRLHMLISNIPGV